MISFAKQLTIAVLSMFLMLSSHVSAQIVTDAELLVVEMKNGIVQTIQLSETPKVSFDGDCVHVTSSDGAFSKEYGQVRKFYYQTVNKPIVKTTTGGNNGISKTMEIDASSLKKEIITSAPSALSEKNILSFKFVDGKNVCIGGLDKSANVSVYAINGTKMPATITRNVDSADVSLQGLQPGVYIIKVGTEAFKVRVK